MSKDLQNRLSAYEVPPPSRVWDALADALDSGTAGQMAQRLEAYEEVPHPRNWQKIIFLLNQKTGTVKKTHFLIRYSRPLKYSGAAAIFIVLAVLSSLLLSKKTISEVPQSTMTIQPSGNSTEQLPVDPVKDTSVPAGGKELTASVSSGSGNQRKISHRSRPIARMSAFSFADPVLPRTANRPASISYTIPADQYMIFSDTKGNAVRLSKKLFDLYSCAENDRNCRQRIKLMQEKLAAYAVTSDFTGILEILRNLQENQ